MVSHKWLDSPDGRKWRRCVIDLRGGLCSGCSSDVREGHRVLAGTQFYRVFMPSQCPDLESDPHNGFMLCQDCASRASSALRYDRNWGRFVLEDACERVLSEDAELWGIVEREHEYDDADDGGRFPFVVSTKGGAGSNTWAVLDSDMSSLCGYNSTRSDRETTRCQS